MTQANAMVPKTAGGAITGPQGGFTSRYEGSDSEDTILPRIHIFQGLPAESEKFGKLDSGQLVNTVTGEVLESTKFIPLMGYNQWIKWKQPRGSGMEYTYRKKSEVPPNDLDWDRERGTPPAATKYMNFVVLFEGEQMPAVLSFSKTSVKAGRTLATLEKMRGPKGPGLYDVGIQKRSNSKGAWVSPVIKSLGNPPDEFMQQATDLFNSLNPATVDTNMGDAPDVESDDGEYDPNAD